MKRHRLFIAINLPEDIRDRLTDYQKKIEELFTPYLPPGRGGSGPIRWTKPNNLHITLNFLGYLADEELAEICKIAKEVASKNSSFFVNLNKICYGPIDKKPPRPPKFSETVITKEDKNGTRKFGRPRMIWAVGEKSEKFASLRGDLDRFLSVSEKREFSPHITLGRINQWEWKRIEPEERPAVEEEINLRFSVDSIEVMESVLKRTGPEYTILESVPLV